MKRNFLPVTLLAALLGSSAIAFADSEPAPASGSTFEPRVLSAEDVRLYREIFEDEREARFADAKQAVAQLNDHCLVGYAVAEHLLSPHGKRASAKELEAWLEEYNELPIANRIRELAVQRNKHHRIAILPPEIVQRRGGGYEDTDLREPPLASDASRQAFPQILTDIKTDQPAAAEDVLKTLQGGTVEEADVARLTHRVAASYLAEGMDADAYRVASEVTRNDYQMEPKLNWDAGISAFKLGKFQESAGYFEALAETGSVPSFTRSAAAFWAARAHTQAGEPLKVVSLLTAAAREEPTFYGMLAERLLGQDLQAGFSEPVIDHETFENMMRIAAAHRAVALSQIGVTEPIPAEMNRALASIDLHQQGQGFAALARALDQPNLELRASETQASRGNLLTGLYPVPRYRPVGGYVLDPALVLAFARAESRFQANAVSPAGARGVMQIMPATAKHLQGADVPDDQLYDPAFNMGLGQRQLRDLLDQVNGNLVQLAAAYDAGPGTLTRWLGTRQNQLSDPLLFIESMPSPETRTYVKEVLMYYWMYSRRTGEAAPTLDDTAAGKWPRYKTYMPSGPVAAAPAPQPETTRVGDASAPD